jgi:hypothetical protein
VPLTGALLSLGVIGCREDERRQPVADELPAEQVTARVGPYAIGSGTLYRTHEGAAEAVGALPGIGVAADTLVECGGKLPELGPARFSRLRLSPDTARAAWATSGPGTCVGVIGPAEPPVHVLGYWPAAATDSLLWAPAGVYLAVWLVHHGQRRSLWLYDALQGEKLEMPWELDCKYVGDCDVERVDWLGGSLLNVEIRLGPAEGSVPFEVNVEATASLDMREEM